MAPTKDSSLSPNTPLPTIEFEFESNPKPRVSSGNFRSSPSTITSLRSFPSRNLQLSPLAVYIQHPDPRIKMNPYSTISYDTVLGGGIQDTGIIMEPDEEYFLTFARRLEQDLRRGWPLKAFYDHKDKLAKKITKAQLEQATQEYKAKLRRQNPHFSKDYIDKAAYRYALELYTRDMHRDWSDQKVNDAVNQLFRENLRKIEIDKQIRAEREGVRGFVGNAGAGIASVGDRDGLAERTEALRRQRAGRLRQLGGGVEGAAVVESVAQARQTNDVSKAAVAGPSIAQQPSQTSTGKQATQIKHAAQAKIAAGGGQTSRAQEQKLQGLRRQMKFNEQMINRERHPTQQILQGLLHMGRQSHPGQPLPGKVPGVQEYLQLANRRRAAESRDGSVEVLGEARVGGEGGQSQGQVLQMQVQDQQEALRQSSGHTSPGEESESQSQRQSSAKQQTEVQQLERTSRKRSIDGTVVQRSPRLQQDGILTSPGVQVCPQFAQHGNSQAGEGSGSQPQEQQPTLRLPSPFANETVQQQFSVPTNVQQQLQEYTAGIRNQQRGQQLAQNGVHAQVQQRQLPSQQLQNWQTVVSVSPVQRESNFPQEQNTRNVAVNSSPVQQGQPVQNTGLNGSVQQTQCQQEPRQNVLQTSPVQQRFPPQQQAMQRQNSQNGYGVGMTMPTQKQVLQQSSPTQPQQFLSQHQAMQHHNIQNGYGNVILSPHQHTQQQLQQNPQMTALQRSPIQHPPHPNFQQSINQQQFPVQPPSNQNQNMIGNSMAAQVSQQRNFYPQSQPQLQSHQNGQNDQNTLVNGSEFQQQVIPQQLTSPQPVLYQQSVMQQQQLPQQTHRGQNVNAGGYGMSTLGFYTPHQHQHQHQQLTYINVPSVSASQQVSGQVPGQGHAGQVQQSQGESWRAHRPHGQNQQNGRN